MFNSFQVHGEDEGSLVAAIMYCAGMLDVCVFIRLSPVQPAIHQRVLRRP